MEVGNQKSQAAKLTRTQSSSLLRSSPTVRSPFHSLPSVTEIERDHDLDLDLEEQKPHSTKPKPEVRTPPVQCGSITPPVLAILSLSGYTLYASLTKHEEGLSTSENLLLSLTFVALLLFIVSKNKTLLSTTNQLCSRLRFCSKTSSKPVVEWFIGETEKHDHDHMMQKQGGSSFKKVIREAVELYSNGDVYEGEFHKGRCNGSGVYSYLVNGRYEGDWIDGKYDGYGIESWARGSRYRGQYRQGLRHGCGVYRLYTGDSYAGEWCNGQSHGVGVQTCADGSCYDGEFRFGVKHGLGCYHFRWIICFHLITCLNLF